VTLEKKMAASRLVRMGLQSVGYAKKSEQSNRREVSGIKAISRGSPLFSFVCFLHKRFLQKNKKMIVRHQQYQHVGNERRCDVFIFWKIIENWYKSIMSSVDVQIMGLKLCVVVTVFS